MCPDIQHNGQNMLRGVLIYLILMVLTRSLAKAVVVKPKSQCESSFQMPLSFDLFYPSDHLMNHGIIRVRARLKKVHS